MPLYYFECDMGCGIRVATNLRQAESRIRREVGTFGDARNIRKATKRDIDWVRGMGGHVPDDPVARAAIAKAKGESNG